MKCQYQWGCPRMAADNPADLCHWHYQMMYGPKDDE